MSAPRLYRLPSSSERNTAAGIFASSVVGVVGALILLRWVGTQWAAWKLAYQPALGAPPYAATPGTRGWLPPSRVEAGG